jgi:hypothetical protein
MHSIGQRKLAEPPAISPLQNDRRIAQGGFTKRADLAVKVIQKINFSGFMKIEVTNSDKMKYSMH